jgi:predicted ATPase
VLVTPSPLTDDDVWQMVHEMGRLRSPSGGRRFAARLREITDGNPFHLVELIKTLFAEGLLALDADTGEWMAPNDGGPGGMQALLMPRTVHAVIRERVTSLPYELRDLLATIAVAGRGVKTDLLSHVHGMSRLRAAALSDGLVERRLLIQEPGVYRAHPVVGEVVRESLTPARRAEVHRAIALSLETTTAPEGMDEVAGEIARLAARGGERAMAYRFAVLGSEAATRQYAYEDALSWLDLAASVALEGGETEKVNRLTAEVLRLAGWTEPRRAPRRPGTPARGIGRADIDLAGTRDEGQSRV